MESKIKTFKDFEKINESNFDDLTQNIKDINSKLNLEEFESGSFTLISQNNMYCVGKLINSHGAYRQFSNFLSYKEINIFIEAMIKTIDFIDNYGTVK